MLTCGSRALVRGVRSWNCIRFKLLEDIENLRLFGMPRAFVLFNVESGLEDKVLEAAKNINQVEEAFVSYGVYDLIVKVKADSVEQLKEVVTHKLRTLDHVRSTLTLILVDE